MALIPIEHPRRLASPAEVEALYRGLRAKEVKIHGFCTRDPALIRTLVAAVDVDRENTVSFCDGTLAGDAFADLATGDYGYLDIRTSSSSLRSWPGTQIWVRHGDAEHFETTDIAAALAAFADRTEDRLVRGHLTGARASVRPRLERFLLASGAEVGATLYVRPAVARQLSEAFAGGSLEWQAPPVLVELPAGRIFGFLVHARSGPRHRARWLRAVDKALRRAELGAR